jgi:hypothetical protein
MPDPDESHFGIFRTAWWMASVMVIATEYDSHRPRLWEPAEEGAGAADGIGADQGCTPQRFGQLGQTSRVVAIWSLAVLEPALPGRSRAATGSTEPAGPWSTREVRDTRVGVL